MERSWVNLESLKDIPGYRVILKTVLHSQIQQLAEQLSKQTEEEVVFLTASLGDGTISHFGSRVGKEFLHDNDEVKSRFLAFCLKRQHEISTNQQSTLPTLTKAPGQGPVPLKITASSTSASHRHSPYTASSARQRNNKRQSKTIRSDQCHNDMSETVTNENDRKILESVSIELVQDDDDADDCDVTDNEGLSDDLDDSGQKLNEITIKNVRGHFQSKGDSDTTGSNNHGNFEAFISDSNVKVESVHTSRSSEVVAGTGFQFGTGLDPSSGLYASSQSVGGASGSHLDIQDNDSVLGREDSQLHDVLCVKQELLDGNIYNLDGNERLRSNNEYTQYPSAEGERSSVQYTVEEMLEKREVRGKPTKAQLIFSSLIRDAAILAQIWKTAPPLARISAYQKECFLNAVFKVAPQLGCLRKEVWHRLGLNLQNRRKYLQDKNAGKRSTKTTKDLECEVSHNVGPESPFVGESINETEVKIERVFSSSSEFKRERSVNETLHEKDGRFYCDQCDFISNFKQSLRKHLWKVHHCEEYKPLKIPPRFTKVNGLYRCQECSFTCVVSSNLKRHIGCKHRKQKFKCGICDKMYSSQYNLSGHIRAMHENTKLMCDVCSKQFNTRRSLHFHQRKVHDQDYIGKYQCKICDKYFADPRHFDGHMSMHSGKKSHMCDICGTNFYYYSSLTKHRETCTGLKRKPTPEPVFIICDVCGAEFTRKSSLNEHKNGVHGEKLFDRACPCGVKFKWRNSLRRHRQICEVAIKLSTDQD